MKIQFQELNGGLGSLNSQEWELLLYSQGKCCRSVADKCYVLAPWWFYWDSVFVELIGRKTGTKTKIFCIFQECCTGWWIRDWREELLWWTGEEEAAGWRQRGEQIMGDNSRKLDCHW